jgi:hypothetical protein
MGAFVIYFKARYRLRIGLNVAYCMKECALELQHLSYCFSVDEIEAAHSLAFNPSGDKLYCGFKNSIRIFNTNLPGRQCETRNLKGE